MRQYFLRDKNETQIRVQDMKIYTRKRELYANSHSRIFVCQCIVYVHVSVYLYIQL